MYSSFFTIKATSSFSAFCSGIVHVLLHLIQQGTSLICFIFFFSNLSRCFHDDVPFVVLSLFVVCSTFCHFIWLNFFFLAFSLQLLFQVCFFSSKAVPNASTLREMSFHLLWSLELFHLSCELCRASSTADARQFVFRFGFPILR